jgi:hypothetical protein
MVAFATEGEIVDVGQSAGGPFVDVMNLGEVAGDIATGSGAATVSGVQNNSLIC